MRYLLDTCVVSEGMIPHPSPTVLEFLDSLEPEQAYLSVLAVAELRRGIDRLPESRKKTALERWFNDDLMVEYAGQIVGVDLRAALVWGSLVARLERTGRILPVTDSWMAAVAIAGDLVLVTRNIKDVADAGARVLNPWQ
ncbi:MAG: type II toxin-antitoxin system VapC family toxin [Tepidisphaeraceae bacterium]|jgi:tRNA(fMet)-specific endonuclease VapC